MSNLIKPKNNEINEYGFDKDSNLKWKDDFYFIVAADTQFGQFDRLGLINRDNLKGRKVWYKEIELAEKFVECVNNLKILPKFIIMCGDMLDQFSYKLVPGIWLRTFTNELDPVRDEQYADFLKVMSKLNRNIKLICVCGNHDIGDSPNDKFRERYIREFGDEYFKFFVDGVLFIGLCSNYWYDDRSCKHLTAKQDQWLIDVLEETKDLNLDHIIIFQHVPFFVKSIDEETSILNIPIEKRKSLIDLLIQYNVNTVFAGHIHTNSVSKYKSLDMISTSAIGYQNDPSEKSGFRLVKIEKNKIKHKYFSFKECSSKIHHKL